ncbi:MAG: ExbD/TolR family protein, partial [bacterium]
MDLKKALSRTSDYKVEDVNITPVMNIFLILIPFLLLTAVFVKIAVIEFSLPSTENRARSQQTQQTKAVVTILAINEKGFDLKTQGLKLSFINKKQQNFDFQTLVQKLREVKRQHQESEDIIIAPQASIKYDTIIKVMDRCRENGFPNI